MFRPGLNARCRARLGTVIVADNNTSSPDLRNVQIRGGASEGLQQWQQHRDLTLERTAAEASTRARQTFLGVRRQQNGAMLATVPSVSPANGKQSTSNHTSDSHADMESSADSDRSESSAMSDGDSGNIKDSQHLLRISSGASMAAENDVNVKERESKVVHPGSGSMLEEKEGENEVEEDLNIRPESPARNSEVENHSIQGEPESAATTWTDDKHSSFLDSMEATFVRSLYNQQGLGHMGVYGSSAHVDDSEQDCVESRPQDAFGCCTSSSTELFELVQGGQLQQKSYCKPHGLDQPPAATTTAVLANPWVRHFKQRILKSEDASYHLSTCVPDAFATPIKEVASVADMSETNMYNLERDETLIGTTAKDNDGEEKQHSEASEDIDNKETQTCVEVPEIEQGFRLWQNRLNVGGQPVINHSSRKDTTAWVLKRPPTFDIEKVDVLVTKRIKSTQMELAEKDLEMLEQYVAKQRAESVQAAGGHSEQAILEHARKVVDTAEEAGPSSASDKKDTRKVAGRSAMDQVVPLLGRMDSYESRSSLSFPDLNAPSHLPAGAACGALTTEPSNPESRERRTLLVSVPDLNAPLRVTSAVVSAYTTNQPTINFIKDDEAVATAWSPRLKVESMEESYFHELAGTAYQPFAQGCQEADEGGNLSLGLQTKAASCSETAAAAAAAGECEPSPQHLSPISNSRTWTWGLGGFRRRLHDLNSVGTVPSSSSQPSRSLRDGIHFSDPVPFRSSGQQV